MTNTLLRRFTSCAKFLLAFGALGWLLYGGQIDLRKIEKIAHSPLLFVIFGFVVLSVFLASERFRYLLEAQGIEVTRGACMRLNLIGLFFNFLIPGGVGGDVVKAYYVQKSHGDRVATGPYTVLFDRLLGLYVLLMMALVAIICDINRFWNVESLRAVALFVCAVCLGMSLFIAFVASGRVRRRVGSWPWLNRGWVGAFVERIFRSLELYRARPDLFAKSVVLSLGGHLSSMAVLIVAGYAMGETAIPLLTYFTVGSVGFVVAALPIAPAGVGVGQAAFLFLFNLYLGGQSVVGPTLITIYQGLLFILSLSGLGFYLTRPRLQR